MCEIGNMKPRSVRWYLQFSILFSCLFYFHLSASAADRAATTDRLIRVPVFSITDRNLQPSKLCNIDFGPHRKYISDCKHDPFMGSAYCVVDNVDHKAITTHLQDLGWAKAEATDKSGAFAATPLTDDNFQQVQ